MGFLVVASGINITLSAALTESNGYLIYLTILFLKRTTPVRFFFVFTSTSDLKKNAMIDKKVG
jgi:hypothetical protein